MRDTLLVKGGSRIAKLGESATSMKCKHRLSYCKHAPDIASDLNLVKVIEKGSNHWTVFKVHTILSSASALSTKLFLSLLR